jgi:biotin transport system substrate-specific component
MSGLINKTQQFGKAELNTKDLISVSMFTALMIAGAFIKIPFPLVPVTFQAFFSALSAIMLGPRLGAVSQAIYLLLGIVGLPVFAQGGGFTYVFKPGFGFIIGFIAGSYVTGTVLKHWRKHTVKHYFVALLTGLLTIYAAGLPYMYLILKFYLGDNEIGFSYLLLLNLPYFIKDAVLMILISVTAGSLMNLLRKARK